MLWINFYVSVFHTKAFFFFFQRPFRLSQGKSTEFALCVITFRKHIWQNEWMHDSGCYGVFISLWTNVTQYNFWFFEIKRKPESDHNVILVQTVFLKRSLSGKKEKKIIWKINVQWLQRNRFSVLLSLNMRNEEVVKDRSRSSLKKNWQTNSMDLPIAAFTLCMFSCFNHFYKQSYS